MTLASSVEASQGKPPLQKMRKQTQACDAGEGAVGVGWKTVLVLGQEQGQGQGLPIPPSQRPGQAVLHRMQGPPRCCSRRPTRMFPRTVCLAA